MTDPTQPLSIRGNVYQRELKGRRPSCPAVCGA
ncbi:hypothetical protein STVIR_3820 [Streptomyces viridochromogenes Tue57]|uniref:Uncharacterized protein n=1 Tax=Streptomyces viridochromogenes Tue57 TaxID=1160705 RepID=L8PGA3_STRVR|nr:hypothetical protein STVIR_3820 [Streptomyces viridochromogenes Tue57]